MTLDQIEQMVRAANPVPDATALDSPETGNDLEPSARDQTSRRSRVIGLAALAAAMILVAGVAVLVAYRGEHTTRIEPANPSPSPTASTSTTTTTMPPASSAWLLPQEPPSLPTNGELVAAINIRHRGVYRLYADGRLIQVWDHREQRLTPDGVERVRNRFLASGLFDSAEPVSDIDGFCAISACVRDGDDWLQVQVDVGGPSESQAPPEAVDLWYDLTMLESWLPASEWVDSQVKPHVAGLIGTCLSMSTKGAPAPFDRSALLSRFPAGAAEVLAAHERSAETERRLGPLALVDGHYTGPGIEPQIACFELPLEEARTLADALLAPSGGGTYDDGIELGFAHAWFFPLLPDKWPFDAFGD